MNLFCFMLVQRKGKGNYQAGIRLISRNGVYLLRDEMLFIAPSGIKCHIYHLHDWQLGHFNSQGAV